MKFFSRANISKFDCKFLTLLHNVNAYRLFPVPCDKILKTRGALERWFDNWKNNAGALILYAEGQNKPINRVKAVNAKASEIPKSFSLDDN